MYHIYSVNKEKSVDTVRADAADCGLDEFVRRSLEHPTVFPRGKSRTRGSLAKISTKGKTSYGGRMRTKWLLGLWDCHRAFGRCGCPPSGNIPGSAVAPSEDCDQRRKAPGTHPCLALGVVTSSVWNDGTIALAIPTRESLGVASRQTDISALSLSSGKLAKPASLPQSLGDIGPASRAISNRGSRGLRHRRLRTADIGNLPRGWIVASVLIAATDQYREVGAMGQQRPCMQLCASRSRRKNCPPVKIVGGQNPVGPPIPDGPSISPLPVVPSQRTWPQPRVERGNNHPQYQW